MLLRIVDRVLVPGETSLQISLEGEHFVTDYDVSTPSEDLRGSLAAYYDREPKNESVIARLLQYGQQLGQDLRGAFGELDAFARRIETAGHANVDVEIVSDNPEFWSRPWESLILPESRFVLSSAARSFVRRFKVGTDSRSVREFHCGPKNPLRILHVVSRPPDSPVAAVPSVAFDASLDALVTEGSLAFEIWSESDWSEITARLADRERPIHVLHFDGPIRVIDGAARLILSSRHAVQVSDVARALVENQAALLSVESRSYHEGTQPLPAHQGLLRVARDAFREGLGNVLGLSEITDPWAGSDGFRQVYRGCARGLTLAQAIVETRKAQQQKTEVARFTASAVRFHAWPLLTHYSQQPVRLFAEAAPSVDLQESVISRQIHAKLFGFRPRLLPPALAHDGDGLIWPVLAAIRKNRLAALFSLTGEPGSGKTDLTHRLCWHLVQTQRIDFGFYFDVEREPYTADDMLQMIAPVLSLPSTSTSAVCEKLRSLRCGFVLDGFLDNTNGHESVETLLAELTRQGHIVLATGRGAPNTASWTLPPLTDLEHRALAARILRDEKLEPVESEPRWRELLESLHGNPGLTQKTLPLLHAKSPSALIEALRAGQGDKFFDWQWNELLPQVRQLLLMFRELEGAYLELLCVARDQKEPFEPALALFPEHRVSDLITLGRRHGFLLQGSHGHVIDPKALRVLQDQPAFDDPKIRLAFSQSLCEGIRRVTNSVMSTPGSPLIHHLLVNRGLWVRHFEALWFAGDFQTFVSVLQAFEPLLKQAQLEKECTAWMLDLLARTPLVKSNAEASEAQMAWLALAIKSTALDESRESAVLREGAALWRRWFEDQDATTANADFVRFKQVARFLESFLQRCGEWAQAAAVCERLCPLLIQRQSWHGVIQTLQSLARCQLALGDAEGAFATETRILDEIPFDDAPPGIREQSMLGVLITRVSRGISDQSLLDKLRALDGERGRLRPVLDRVQANMDTQQQRPAKSDHAKEASQ